jgi:hypothetical protein
LNKWYKNVLNEIADELVDSSRGIQKPRGVRRRISQYPSRSSGGCNRVKVDYKVEIYNYQDNVQYFNDF